MVSSTGRVLKSMARSALWRLYGVPQEPRRMCSRSKQLPSGRKILANRVCDDRSGIACEPQAPVPGTNHKQRDLLHTTERRSGRRLGDGAVSSAAVNIGAKVMGNAISLVSIAFVARLLTPGDYGLVAMALSVSAFLQVFSDLGLSLVTVQRQQISQEQLSTLFWINVAFGLLLGLITVAVAPGLVLFFSDPRLLHVTIALAVVFPLAGLGVQHQALLKRHMKFRRLAVVRLAGTGTSAVTCIAAAYWGLGYWALVCQLLTLAFVETVAAWLSVRWRPGLPRRCQHLRELLGFGGRLTAHGIIGYFSRNLDKVLLGRFCGAQALGLYSTAYRLMMRPINLAGYSIGDAAIPAMSRQAHDQDAMKGTYRRMFSFTCLLGLPACVAGAFWADDVVLTLLGHRWIEAIIILRILFVAAIPRMLCASTGWIWVASGRPDRMLRWQLMLAPFVALAFVAGLPYGAVGVAIAYALATWIALVPCFAYCFYGTRFKMTDVLQPLTGPLLCTIFACAVAFLGQIAILPHADPGPIRLGLRLSIAMICYVTTTAIFVPLAKEGLRKIARKLGRLVVWVRGDAKASVPSHPGGNG